MRAGQYDKRLRFESPSEEVDRYGDPLPGWTLVRECWAAIRPMGVSERLTAMQMQSGQTHVVTVRYVPALAAARGDWRIVFKGRVFQIVGQPRNPNEANVELVFDCTEGPTP